MRLTSSPKTFSPNFTSSSNLENLNIAQNKGHTNWGKETTTPSLDLSCFRISGYSSVKRLKLRTWMFQKLATAAEGPLTPQRIAILKTRHFRIGKMAKFLLMSIFLFFFAPSNSQRSIFNSNLFGGFSTDFEPIWVSSTFHMETWTTTHGKSEFWYMSRYSRYNITKETYWAFRTLGPWEPWKCNSQRKHGFHSLASDLCFWPVLLPHIGNLVLLKPNTLLTNQHPQHPQHPQHAPRNEVIHHILLPIGTLQELRKPLLHLRASGTLQHNPHPSKKKKSSYGTVLPWRSFKMWRTERRKPREETNKAWLNLASVTRGVLMCVMSPGSWRSDRSRISDSWDCTST